MCVFTGVPVHGDWKTTSCEKCSFFLRQDHEWLTWTLQSGYGIWVSNPSSLFMSISASPVPSLQLCATMPGWFLTWVLRNVLKFYMLRRQALQDGVNHPSLWFFFDSIRIYSDIEYKSPSEIRGKLCHYSDEKMVSMTNKRAVSLKSGREYDFGFKKQKAFIRCTLRNDGLFSWERNRSRGHFN